MTADADRKPCEDWWTTEIIEMQPGMIRLRGYPIEQLIGTVDFPTMIWLMLRGELPTAAQSRLLGIALAAAVDHGPQAPSIASARMAATCGVGINNAMASAINLLGDAHGGAGQQCVTLFYEIADAARGGPLAEPVAAALDRAAAEGVRFVPGYGHRFHPVDPRAPRLLHLIDEAAGRGEVSGRFAAIGREVERQLTAAKGKPIPMNIDGATAAVYAELGFPPPLCRGLFVLSRSVGILAHIWEQTQQGGRNKGPIPRDYIWTYAGKPERPVPGTD